MRTAHDDVVARWGKRSLTLDLMEEFRPVIVDAVVLRCLSAGIVRFEKFTTTPDLGCRPHRP